MKVDALVVGAGFAGSVVAERLARGLGKKVLLVEKRNHVGGNSHDAYDDHGVLVQRYGPHIFHTPSKSVWEYVNRFSEWILYQHHVIGFVDGRLVPIPFNLNSLEALLPHHLASTLERKLVDRYGYGKKVPVLELRRTGDNDLEFLSEFVYEKVFRFYTAKQWDARLEDLTPAASARVPVFVSRDDRYFQHPYQGIPSNGYHRLFERMLDHPNIRILLNTDYKEVIGDVHFARLIYTGPIDAFFDYRHGRLRYRSLRFEWTHLPEDRHQSNSVINYPCDHAFTRCTEYKHFTGQKCPGTTISREFPCWVETDADIPYYPMPDEASAETLKRYEAEAKALPHTDFLGRLAQYRYIDMADVVAEGLALADQLARLVW